MIPYPRLAFALPLLLLMAVAQAENSTRIPGYTIYHSALTTDMLDPKVAHTYGIQRSKSKGMLNVSVIRDVPGTTGKPVPAEVHARAVNFRGQTIEIPMREIDEQDAIYYIGEFHVHNQEHLNFTIEVRPEGSQRTHKILMKQQFFVD